MPRTLTNDAECPQCGPLLVSCGGEREPSVAATSLAIDGRLESAQIPQEPPSGVPETHRRLAAIMFTDMVGYSALAQQDEAAALALLDEHNRLLRPIFAHFHGREVKTVGDAFLVEFESALDAARCALEVQETLRKRNESVPPDRALLVRIGIHVGDVVQTNGDLLGDAVNVASRIQPLADPGGICFSQQVYDQIRNKISAPIAQLAPVALKNIRLPVTVYKFVPSPERPRDDSSRDGRRERGLAVLPLANISPDPKDEYFADGLTEELISVLSQVQGLSVIARTSVTPYKTSPKSVAQVGAELGVDTVLEGSVRKAGNRIRITLQLVDVPTQRHIWANSYNRELDDVFAVQTDVAERTAASLRLELGAKARSEVTRKPTENLEAYDLYLRGLVGTRETTEEAMAETVRCFEQATKLDPTFADAYAAWADFYVIKAGDFLRMREVMPRARELALRAVELDPNSSEAHSALGNIALQFDNDWPRAEAEFNRALAINPSNARALSFYGLELVMLGRYDEAKELFRRLIRLDPGGLHERQFAWVELTSGHAEAALRQMREEVDRDPTRLEHHIYLGLFYLEAGRLEDAAREAAFSAAGASEEERFDHALLNALVGRPEEARAILAEEERGEAKSYNSGTVLAMLYATIGEKEKALDHLERDAHEGDRVLWLYFRGIFFDSIREDPRFVALLREYGLPTTPPLRLTNPSSGGGR